MKRFISILFMISLCTVCVFAEEEEKELPETEIQEEGYIYEPNGPGDQSLKIGLMASFPLNFD